MNTEQSDNQTKTIRVDTIKIEPPPPPRDDALVPQLTVISGQHIGTVFRLQKNRQQMTIGRGDADFVLADDLISRRHAALMWHKDNVVYLHDLGSTNGTFVNGERINSWELAHGDKIACGDIILRFELLDPLDAQYQSEIAKKLTEAVRDPLTGLYTRKHLDQQGEKLLTSCLLKHKPLSVLMLDLDYFKTVNDTYGHPTGDVVLKTVGTVILKTTRSVDLVCRYGGEEIIILLPDCALKPAYEFAERLRQIIADQAIITAQDSLNVTISCGVAEVASTESLAEGIERADKGLYLAKQTGRNRIAFGPFPKTQ